MLITAYPDIVRREGLAVEVVSGFASRSHGEFQRNPPYCVWHHDASPAGPSPGVLGWMIDNWNNASANAWVDYNGKWWFVGAGVAYHAGAVLPGMPNNQTAFGIETDYTVDETISWNLYDSLRRGTAAIFRANGQPASDLHFHKTICSPPGRKSDPWALDLGTERAALAKLIAGGNSPLPLPDQDAPGGPGGADPQGFLMALSDADQAELLNKVRLLYSDNEIPGQGYGKQAAGFNDVRGLAERVKALESKVDGLPDAVWAKAIKSLNDGKEYSAAAFLSTIDFETVAPPKD